MQTITELLAQELNCRQEYIANVIALLDEEIGRASCRERV